MIYRCIIALIVDVDGVKHRSFLFTENFSDADKARDFGEFLLKQKICVGYRVVFAKDDNDNYRWIHHEYVKFITEEQARMPVLSPTYQH